MELAGDQLAQDPPLAGSEVEALVGALDRMRGYLLWKCAGGDTAGLRATVDASSHTLGGLLKHLAAIEAVTFSWKLHGRRPFPPFGEADWDGEGHHANVRRLVLDMIEEYARHTGHADLIRETVDGVVGEDPRPGLS